MGQIAILDELPFKNIAARYDAPVEKNN